jgi:hypothetical protein
MPRERAARPGADLKAFLVQLAEEIARFIEESGPRGDSGAPSLERWPGNRIQLRRTQARLRTLNVEMHAVLIGRAYYVRRSLLERLPEILSEPPPSSRPANDTGGVEQTIEDEAAELNASMFERPAARGRGKKATR